MSPVLIRKWHALAQRRRAHFVDLYQSGRWRAYYSEAEFLRTARAAFDLAEHWQRIAGTATDPLREAS